MTQIRRKKQVETQTIRGTIQIIIIIIKKVTKKKQQKRVPTIKHKQQVPHYKTYSL